MATRNGQPRLDPSEPSSAGRLDSWKEIAVYLKRDESTVRRWEKEGLPVHRKVHAKKASVYAFKSELDEWWNADDQRFERGEPATASHGWRSRSFALRLMVLAVGLAIGVTAVTYVSGRLTGPATSQIRSLAVLPFADVSANRSQEYVANGVTREVIAQLSKVGGLNKVVSHASILRYETGGKAAQQLARELDVDGVVTGSVVVKGDGIVVTIRLYGRSSDREVWRQSFAPETRGIRLLSTEIARSIARAIAVKLTGEEEARLASTGSVSPEVDELYWKARFVRDRQRGFGLRDEITLLREALTREPDAALVHAELSFAYATPGTAETLGVAPRQVLLEAKESAIRALDLDPTLAEAHLALALVKLNYDWEWATAEREFRRALELSPHSADAHHWYAHLLTNLGRHDEALRVSRQALALDPLSSGQRVHLTWHYLEARNYDMAAEQGRALAALLPKERYAYDFTARALSNLGRHTEAIAQAQQAVKVSEHNPLQLATLAWVYARADRRREAVAALRELQNTSSRRYVSPASMAAIHAALQQFDEAFRYLDKAYDERDTGMPELNVESRFDPLRSDPRFRALLARMNLPIVKP